MSPRDLTVGDLAALRSRGVRFAAARVTSTGIVARVLTARAVVEAHRDPWRGVAALREHALPIEHHAARMLALGMSDDLVTCRVCGGSGEGEPVRSWRCPETGHEDCGAPPCDACEGHGGVPRYAEVAS